MSLIKISQRVFDVVVVEISILWLLLQRTYFVSRTVIFNFYLLVIELQYWNKNNELLIEF